MLRGSRINPKLSAYQQIWGDVDYNQTPLAPPGCLAVIYDAPEDRPTWSNHAQLDNILGQLKITTATTEFTTPQQEVP